MTIELTYGDDLRDHAKDPEELRRRIDLLKSTLADCGADKARALSELGTLLRLDRRLDDARKTLEGAALLFSERDDKRGLLVARIRLGHVLQWQKEFSTSESILRDALEDVRANPDLAAYEDFALQHLGKCLFDQERYEEALPLFKETLGLRETKGDMELLRSAAEAVKQTKMRLEAQTGKSPGPKR